MTTRGRALLAVLVVPLACGARTGLVLPGDIGSGESGGSSGGGTTPLAVACNAALLDGAPTPITGYCTTRANQAPVNGPRVGPQIVWSVAPFPIMSPEDYLPAETVVDATGRAYVAIAASPQNATGGPNQILTLNGDGSLAWVSASPSPVAGLALDRGGLLWFLEEGLSGNTTCPAPCPFALVALSSDGTTVASFGSANLGVSGPDLMAIASDGSFFIGSNNDLARITTSGATLWQTYASLGPSLVVGPNDGVIAVGNDGVDAYDAAGNMVWDSQRSAQVIAVGPAGDVEALSSPDGQSWSVLTLGAGGSIVQDVALGSSQFNAFKLAVAGDGTTVVLLANEATAPGLTKSHVEITAVDASGKTRWTTPLDVSLPYDPADLTTHYGLFVDAAGTVVVTAGTVMGLDLASGSVLWTLPPAKPNVCLRPAVLGTGGAILATQCDGTVFLARDP